MSLKAHFQDRSWTEWDHDIKMRLPAALRRFRESLSEEIGYQKFVQYQFFRQWMEVKAYANLNQVKIIGDIPIFTALDSADTWSRPELFQLDGERRPRKVAGVPPDYFSEAGQRWGNPLYDWDKLRETGYAWWIQRFQAVLELVDIVRLDHFRGFAAYWAIPAARPDAREGTWEPGPGHGFFEVLRRELGEVPVIAEDLGVVTPDVEELRDGCGFPGMKILQFGFDSHEGSPYLPHLFPLDCVVYTGTHDNDTTRGWFEKAGLPDREYTRLYLGGAGQDIAWDFIRLAMASTAVLALFPLQDVLGLGSEARMNTPGTSGQNWRWRYRAGMLTPEAWKKLRMLAGTFQR
jgi:4-alpha-glucanotransferase